MSIEHTALMNSKQNVISLVTLPAELLCRICDFLDTETLLCSVRYVSVKLYMITNTYNRYKIFCHSISNVIISQLIQPENVILLDFGTRNNAINWTELFLPMFKTFKFTRLQSLSVHQINNISLGIILHHVAMNCMLTSFALYSDIPKDRDDIFQFLSQIIAQSTLYTVTLYFNLSEKNKFSWPIQSTVQKLSMDTCTIQQLCSILDNSLCLHSLTMNNCHMTEIYEAILLNSYQQVTSLTLNDLRLTMDKLEVLLSLLPSITYLDLTSSGKPYEFVRRLSQWEGFIQSKLPKLYQLEFFIFCYCSNWENFESLIDAFRTPFWLEDKRWFVTCQFRDDWISSFTIFTSPETSLLSYQGERYFDKVLCSKSAISEYN